MNLQIMLVDRNDAAAAASAKALGPFCSRVHKFSDPDLAIHAFGRNPDQYDLVIADSVLCSLSGLELAREMREVRRDIPVVLTMPPSVIGFVDSLDERPFSHATTKARIQANPGAVLAASLEAA